MDVDTIMPYQMNSVAVLKVVGSDIVDGPSMTGNTGYWSLWAKQVAEWRDSGVDCYMFFDCPRRVQQTPVFANFFRDLLAEYNVTPVPREGLASPQNESARAQNPELLRVKKELEELEKLPEELSDNRVVFSRGNPEADIVCIGEAPGKTSLSGRFNFGCGDLNASTQLHVDA